MSILTREEEREPCRERGGERGGRAKVFMEGVGRGQWRWVGDGDRICPPPFPNPRHASCCVARAPPAGLSVA